MDDPSNHFFKFIPPGFKFKLSIPTSYLRNLDGWRCKKAILRRGHHKWVVHIGERGVFSDGWRKFVAENGVQELDFIVFKDQGNMVFDFFVFDQSTCERRYPNLPDDVEVSLTESDSLYTHKRSKMLKKRKRSDYASQSKDELRVDNDRCFVTIMTAGHIKAARLSVPMKFARSNGLTTKGIHTQIVLVDEAKRICQAKLHIRTDQIRLLGWHKIVIENNLKVGDTCLFKLVKAGEVPVFKFYRKKHTKNHIQVNKETSSTIKKTTGSSLGNHPYFNLTMKPSYKEWGLYLPVEFSKSNGLKVGEMILQDDQGRSWKIRLKKKRDEKYLYFHHGFRAFWDANRLKVGDDYKFVLIDKKKAKPPIMIVSLNVHSDFSRKKDPSNYVGKVRSYYMYLSSEFVTTNGLLNKEAMSLTNDDERSWTMDIKRDRKFCYIGRGWKEFRVANGLKEGDLIKLEMVSNGEIPVAKFHVLKIH